MMGLLALVLDNQMAGLGTMARSSGRGRNMCKCLEIGNKLIEFAFDSALTLQVAFFLLLFVAFIRSNCEWGLF